MVSFSRRRKGADLITMQTANAAGTTVADPFAQYFLDRLEMQAKVPDDIVLVSPAIDFSLGAGAAQAEHDELAENAIYSIAIYGKRKRGYVDIAPQREWFVMERQSQEASYIYNQGAERRADYFARAKAVRFLESPVDVAEANLDGAKVELNKLLQQYYYLTDGTTYGHSEDNDDGLARKELTQAGQMKVAELNDQIARMRATVAGAQQEYDHQRNLHRRDGHKMSVHGAIEIPRSQAFRADEWCPLLGESPDGHIVRRAGLIETTIQAANTTIPDAYRFGQLERFYDILRQGKWHNDVKKAQREADFRLFVFEHMQHMSKYLLDITSIDNVADENNAGQTSSDVDDGQADNGVVVVYETQPAASDSES
jgi:hypothetical protein